MSAAAYNRGSRLVARDADERMPLANARADQSALAEENERLRLEVEALTRDLRRARRCIAELRRSKAERLDDAHAEIKRCNAAIDVLCRIAFPDDAVITAADGAISPDPSPNNSRTGAAICGRAGVSQTKHPRKALADTASEGR